MDEIEKTIKDKAFDDFIDGAIYENASTAIWELVKAAYNDAWIKAKEPSAGISRENE